MAHSNPILAIAYGFIALDMLVLDIGIFQIAFKVTEMSEDLKKVIEVKYLDVRILDSSKYCKRILKSIPRLGVKVGGFHEAERESVPVFIDFVTKQIVSLLITF